MKRGTVSLPKHNQDLLMTGFEAEILALMRDRNLNCTQIAVLLGKKFNWVRRAANCAAQKEQAAFWNEITKQQAGGSTSLSVARGHIRMKGTR